MFIITMNDFPKVRFQARIDDYSKHLWILMHLVIPLILRCHSLHAG